MATVKVIEQPTKVLRFRYEREGRTGGLIFGASSTSDNKTYPKIRIEGYQGRALVIVSCVTKDEPYRPHPNKLVGKDGCRKGVCSVEVSPDTMSAEFTNLGIHCMRRKDVEESLKLRKDIRVDPFRTGFAHYKHSVSFDLTTLRLCFQVVLQDEHGDFTIPLTPVVSEPILDERVFSKLKIVKLSKCVTPVNSNEEIILVCDKVSKDDIQIRFYEEQDGKTVWEGFGIFQPVDVYKKLVIWFKPPWYKNLNVTKPVKVFIQLQRPSDGERSEPLPFEYLPIESEAASLNRIRQKSRNLLRNFSEPPLSKQEQNLAMLFPENRSVYGNAQPINYPSFSTSPQQQYNLPILVNSMSTTPLIPNLPGTNIRYPNIDIDEPSTSSTIQHPNDDTICDLNTVHDSNMSSFSQQEYSVRAGLFNSESHSPSTKNGFIFPNIQHADTIQDDADKPATITEMENNLIRSNEMEVHTINDLSRLLIDAYSQPSELQLLNLDSGELDTMHMSS